MPDKPTNSDPFVEMSPAFTSATGGGSCKAAYADERGFVKQVGVWLLAFTHFHKIPVFRRVWIYVALMGAYTLVINCFVGPQFPSRVIDDITGAAAFGIVFGLLLAFRTDVAYERWWEGRKLWDRLVNESRNICMEINDLEEVSDEDKIRFGNLVISFAYALKHHLRGTIPSSPLPGFEQVSNMGSVHLPIYVTGKMWEKIVEWQKEGKLVGVERLEMDLGFFMDICGDCEKLRSTPLVVSYRAFMRQGITFNLLAVPWYIPPTLPIGWALPLVSIGTYFMIGLELIAEVVEDPFGEDGDDLPLDIFCSTIRESVNEILAVREKTQFTRSIRTIQEDPLSLRED